MDRDRVRSFEVLLAILTVFSFIFLIFTHLRGIDIDIVREWGLIPIVIAFFVFIYFAGYYDHTLSRIVKLKNSFKLETNPKKGYKDVRIGVDTLNEKINVTGMGGLTEEITRLILNIITNLKNVILPAFFKEDSVLSSNQREIILGHVIRPLLDEIRKYIAKDMGGRVKDEKSIVEILERGKSDIFKITVLIDNNEYPDLIVFTKELEERWAKELEEKTEKENVVVEENS